MSTSMKLATRIPFLTRKLRYDVHLRYDVNIQSNCTLRTFHQTRCRGHLLGNKTNHFLCKKQNMHPNSLRWNVRYDGIERYDVTERYDGRARFFSSSSHNNLHSYDDIQDHERYREYEYEGRHIPVSPGEHKSLKRRHVDSPEGSRMLRVAIIGAPNAGKSTLVNKLIGWKVAAVSKKVHTTRQKTIGVLTEDKTQIVFVDTPGMISPGKVKKFNLERSLLVDPHLAVPSADLMLVVVDVSHVWHQTRLDPELIKLLLLHPHLPSILVLNKVDILKSKQHLLFITQCLTEGVVGGKEHYPTTHTDTEEMFDKMAAIHIHKETDTEDVSQPEETKENDVPSATSRKKDKGPIYHMLGTADVENTTDTHHMASNLEINTNLTDSNRGSGDLARENWAAYCRLMKEVSEEAKSLRGWGGFSEVFMVSALNGDGVDDIKEYLVDHSQVGPWLYPAQLITDQSPKHMARLCLQEKLLDVLPHEIPYNITTRLVLWEEDEGLLRTEFDLVCHTKRQYTHLLGRGGSVIQAVSRAVKQELRNMFRCELTLKLRVIGTPKWRNPTKRNKGSKKENAEDDLDI